MIGKPLLEETVMKLPDGHTFTIIAEKLSDENIYIQSCRLNGAEWDKSYITHETIMKRGIQEFSMGSVSDSGWATSAASFPRNTLSEF